MASEGGSSRRLLELATGFRGAKVLLVAHELGVFAALSAGPADAGTLAAELGADRRALEILLEALAALALVRREADGRYVLGEDAARHLIPGAPEFLGDNLRYQSLLWDCYGELQAVTRSGRPSRSLEARLADHDSRFVEGYQRGIADLAGAPARVVARSLADRPLLRLLDLGGGHGRYSVELLERSPSLTATVVDLEETLVLTRELARESIEAGRLFTRAGNYLDPSFELGSGWDLILLSHVTHDEPLEVNRRLFAAAFDALAPGGRIAVHDFVLTEAGGAPAFAALFAVNLLLYTEGGRVYRRSDYVRELGTAGFRAITVQDILQDEVPNPTCLFTGTRPAQSTRTE